MCGCHLLFIHVWLSPAVHLCVAELSAIHLNVFEVSAVQLCVAELSSVHLCMAELFAEYTSGSFCFLLSENL